MCRQHWRLLTWLAACLLLLCAPQAKVSAGELKEVRIADQKGAWGKPNPYRHYPRGQGYVHMSWVFDTLLWKDKTGRFIPALATTWSYDPHESAFTWNLNPKAKWHDGEPVTAADVVFTIDYFKKYPYRWVNLDHVDRAQAEGPHIVKIFLVKPYAPFLSEVGGTMPILPKHIWETVADPKAYDDPKAFIGSGPYRFKSFNKTHGTYLYEAFTEYYQGSPKAAKLIYVRSKKPMASLINGEVDLAHIRPEMSPKLEEKGMVVIRDTWSWNKKLMINHRKWPFDQKAFRQALAHAINREEIIEKAHGGHGAPASYGLLSIDHEMYNPNVPAYPHDTAGAEALIESLGYKKDAEGFFQKDGKPLKVELLASNVSAVGATVRDRDGEILRSQLEAVGIRTDLVNLEQVTTDNKIKKWDFDLAISGHGGVMGDPKILNEMISSSYGAGSVNCERYDASPELLELLEKQIAEMDPEKRKEFVYEIQMIHAELLPAIPLYYPVRMAAYNPAKGVVWFYTPGGIGKGVPHPQNKISLVK